MRASTEIIIDTFIGGYSVWCKFNAIISLLVMNEVLCLGYETNFHITITLMRTKPRCDILLQPHLNFRAAYTFT